MEFNVNEMIKSIGLKKVIVIILLSTIIFLLTPNNIIQNIGGKVIDILLWQKIIYIIVIIIIITAFIELVIPVIKRVCLYIKKRVIIARLDEQHIKYIKKFYDFKVNEFIKTLSIYNDDKYISSLEEKGIIEWINPLIITDNTPHSYKISSEYKKILKRIFKNK